MEDGGGGIVAAGAVVEDAGAGAEDGLAVARGVGEGDARTKVVVVVEEGLPVVAEADGELGAGVEFNLVLDEGSELVDPVESATDTPACAVKA